jgi:cytochrome c oxidase cbb3-type subunit 3
MQVKTRMLAGALAGLTMSSMFWGLAQQPAAAAAGGQEPQRRVGGFVPGQKRAAEDPAMVAKGKTLYGINCQACHGSDLRGGDLGGPNLLRSQVALTDKDGELIVPIIQGARQAQGMPAIGISIADSKDVAAYVRSVVGMIGVQGTPPGEQKPLNIVTGDAHQGQMDFQATCAKCHASDLQGIASRITDPKKLQETWLEGGIRGGQGPSAATTKATATATVTLPSGDTIKGKLVRMDDFLVTIEESDGDVRTFRRNGDTPMVNVNDPLKAHKDLLPQLTDKEIHDITAYLVTLK